MNKYVANLALVATLLVTAAPLATYAQYGGGGGPPVGLFGISFGGSVLGASTSTVPTGTTTPASGTTKYVFSKNFGFGSRSEDVTQLQTILIADGYLAISTPTGYFGSLTQTAVKKYQKANGIVQTGFVGPLTRAALNA